MKNISYQMDTPYGTMDITINLSKPEKTLNKSNGNAPLQTIAQLSDVPAVQRKRGVVRDESGILPGQTTGLLKSRSPEKTGISIFSICLL
ncbi:hypothetical protein PO124_02240 [Bacillus licheniformis]|nr:hypothetical protein [Bacillus licheniformis]